MCLSIAVRAPDRVLESGEFNGFEYAITHNGNGYRCGYVRLPLGHRLHGLRSEDIVGLDVHGGITFAEPDMPCDKPGADADWWLGFDCAHCNDAKDFSLPFDSEQAKEFIMKLEERLPCDGEIRGIDYVRAECERLCAQVAAYD